MSDQIESKLEQMEADCYEDGGLGEVDAVLEHPEKLKLIKALRRALEDNPVQYQNVAAAEFTRRAIAAILSGEEP
jgi:hypothetical protein